MGRLNFDIDEAALLKAYRISSLNPTCVSSTDVFGRDQNSATQRLTGDGKMSTMNRTVLLLAHLRMALLARKPQIMRIHLG